MNSDPMNYPSTTSFSLILAVTMDNVDGCGWGESVLQQYVVITDQSNGYAEPGHFKRHSSGSDALTDRTMSSPNLKKK